MLLIDEIAGEEALEVGPARTNRLTISVRELLHMRVELEWQAAEDKVEGALRFSHMFADTPEARLNAAGKASLASLLKHRPDARTAKLERMQEVAEQAFLESRIFVLLDDRQAESLDEVIDVERTGSATFLLLTPLQGG